MPEEIVPLIVADTAAWRAWLDAHEDTVDGVWLLLAKKGVTEPTSLSYAQALDEALCSGWIDGRTKSIDEKTYRIWFTPRRTRSLWSARNVDHIARLIEEGRMRARGLDEVERAKADGRWDRAYHGAASIEVPADLAETLSASPNAAALFETLKGQNRYSILHRVTTARTEESRRRTITRLVAMLDRGETPYPQTSPPASTPK